jgi:hypothetical protein
MSASRVNGALRARAPSAGVIARPAAADRKSRRVIVMAWFPNGSIETPARDAGIPEQALRARRQRRALV